MKVSRRTINSAFHNASNTFRKQWNSTCYAGYTTAEIKKQFWKDFSKAHNINITINEFKSDYYPVINDTIEFNNEQDYLMFLLRWS
jgi:hypothetical protein